MSSYSVAAGTKKTGHSAQKRNQSSYHSSGDKALKTRYSQSSEPFSKDSMPQLSWDDLPEFKCDEDATQFDMCLNTHTTCHPDECPCEERRGHFCHECAVCAEECCGLSPYDHLRAYMVDDDSDNDSDQENWDPNDSNECYEWEQEFDFGDISNLWKKRVTWNTEVTLHDSPDTPWERGYADYPMKPNSVKLSEQDFYKYRRPDGSEAYEAGWSPVMRDARRHEVHRLRPDLQQAPWTLDKLNFKINYMEHDLAGREKFIDSLAVWRRKIVPMLRTHVEVTRERRLLNQYLETVDYW